MKTLRRLQGRIRRLGVLDLISFVAWCFIVTVIESTGRATSTDIGDGIVLTMLGTLIALTAVCHQVRSIAWIRAGQQLLRRWKPRSLFDLELGVDLRGRPPIRSGLPDLFWKPGACAAVLAVFALALSPWMPSGLREHVAPLSYTVYLLLLATLWTSLMAGALFFAGLAFCFLHDECVRSSVDPRSRRLSKEVLAFVALSAGLGAGAFLAPDWAPLLLLAAGFGLPALLFLRSSVEEIRVLWRRPKAGGGIWSLRWQDSLALELATCFLVAASGCLLSRGQFMTSTQRMDGVVPLSSLLGLVFSWSAVAAALVVGAVVARGLLVERAFRRSARHPFHVSLRGGSFRRRRRLRRRLQAAGLRVRRPRTRRVELRIELGGEEDQGLLPWTQSRQVRLSARRCEDPELVATLRASARQQLRETLCRAIRLVLRTAERRREKPGNGYWIGVHHWFVSGLTRDESSETTDLRTDAIIDDGIGPRYWRLLPARARAHLREVLAALDVGLLFLEDGVRFKDFRRVLETLFEIHDIHDGRTRAEDRHFVGHPGVRVVLHEFEFERPFRSELYPEPDYEDIGRGRILHVFKDRSDELEYIDLPVDIDSVTPSTSG